MTELKLWFDHGLGDCCHAATLMQLYKRRGYDSIRVHYEANKKAVWDAAGIEYLNECKNYHHFRYYPSFNHPDPHREGSGNKVYLNLNTEGLPDLGDRNAVWRELCAVDMEASFDSLITPELKAETDKFLAHLPRPVVCVHSKGTNFQREKSIPDNVASDLYRLLLDGGCSVVLLDWDFRVPMPPHGRIRHLKRDWGHISTLQLAALLSATDLLIGVDSGPYHLCHFTRTPSLGVFHDFFPWCVSLPRPSGKSAVMTRDSHHHCTVERRALWNAIEYPAPMPNAQDIAKHALRMLKPRYGLSPGRDAMIQQWVRDWCPSSTNTSPIADRHNTLDVVLRLLGRFENPQVVETGCTRGQDDWSAGAWTYTCGAYLDGRRAGKITSVDIDPHNAETARRLSKPWGDRVEVVTSDSVAYLSGRTEKIDLLYLDSMDCEIAQHAAHCLREMQVAEKLLAEDAVVVIDDTVWAGEWRGKGAQAVPWLLDRGWQMLATGYQCVMSRRP